MYSPSYLLHHMSQMQQMRAFCVFSVLDSEAGPGGLSVSLTSLAACSEAFEPPTFSSLRQLLDETSFQGVS